MAHVVSGKLAPSPCPNCGTLLDGATGVSMGEFFERELRLKDRPTMCCYCGALLVFADNLGHLRTMTETERNSVRFAPEIEKILAWTKARFVRPAGDFTKKRFN